MLLLVVAAAGLAGVHAAVQTLALAVDQELEGLQAADAHRVGHVALRAQQLSLRVLLLNLILQITAKDVERWSQQESTKETTRRPPGDLRAGRTNLTADF